MIDIGLLLFWLFLLWDSKSHNWHKTPNKEPINQKLLEKQVLPPLPPLKKKKEKIIKENVEW